MSFKYMEEKKFPFDLSFQEESIRYILNNSDGYKGLKYIKHSYYPLLAHSVIVYAVEQFWEKHKRVITLPFLKNSLLKLFSSKEFADSLTDQDKAEIISLSENLYKRPAKDGDLLLEELAKFAAYVELSYTLEKVDLTDFSSYDFFADRVIRSIHLADPLEEKKGIFLIKEIKERQLNRQSWDLVIPTPIHQLNRLTSGGGYSPYSIGVILDMAKRLKTTSLINLARKYVAQKKPVLYIDLENGEDPIASRMEQSMGRVTQSEIIKGTKDREIQKILRRYKRLGGEVYIRRLPGFSTTSDIQLVIDEVYREQGIRFKILIIDYIALMGSLSGKKDDFSRISDAYIDVGNLLLKNQIEYCWTANHIVREAIKRQPTRYLQTDIAKCIDIVRHVHLIVGLNRTETEFQNGIVRMEIVDQREGVPRGRAYFRVDPTTQRMDELTKKEILELTQQGILYNPDAVYDPEPSQKKEQGDL